MKPTDIKAKSDADLKKMIDDLENELFMLRVKKVTGQLEKTGNLRVIRKDLARVKTVIRERELAGVAGFRGNGEQAEALPRRAAKPGGFAESNKRPDHINEGVK